MICIYSATEEIDNAFKGIVRIFPLFGIDSQPAGDFVHGLVVVIFSFTRSFICCHTISDIFPIHLPIHFDMVRVETRGHTDEGLLPFFVFAVSALMFWRFQYFYFLWWSAGTVFFCKDKGQRRITLTHMTKTAFRSTTNVRAPKSRAHARQTLQLMHKNIQDNFFFPHILTQRMNKTHIFFITKLLWWSYPELLAWFPLQNKEDKCQSTMPSHSHKNSQDLEHLDSPQAYFFYSIC